MLHKELAEYLSLVEKTVVDCQQAYVERYLEEVLTPSRVNLRIRVRFDQGALLEINESVVVKNDRLSSLDYRYHCQDEQNRLVFRYDSTPHFPAISSFPHHKHLPEGVIATAKPGIWQVFQEVKEFVGLCARR
ncbi:toxin TumE [Desulfurivibrio dismutans]|uniref:toxin TumE n=1 Tax=Desulfurivibrio dismutans TaxID=1398908 RepID=UPI0023DB5916|nr:DUF6516 family protein [Desulfurivibrio alkaliphilus]MDF1614045.1 DUF6516 family protein [Desulfurivibrio alkaliphilus]